MKVVINACFGGFGLSPEALQILWDRGMTEIGTPVDEYWPDKDKYADSSVFGYKAAIERWRKWRDFPQERDRGHFLTVFTTDEKTVLNGGREVKRDHPEVVRAVEELGDKANGACAKLKIIEIPDDVSWCVEEYDGSEHIAEIHRTWS